MSHISSDGSNSAGSGIRRNNTTTTHLTTTHHHITTHSHFEDALSLASSIRVDVQFDQWEQLFGSFGSLSSHRSLSSFCPLSSFTQHAQLAQARLGSYGSLCSFSSDLVFSSTAYVLSLLCMCMS
jgi:hypothetical protein